MSSSAGTTILFVLYPSFLYIRNVHEDLLDMTKFRSIRFPYVFTGEYYVLSKLGFVGCLHLLVFGVTNSSVCDTVTLLGRTVLRSSLARFTTSFEDTLEISKIWDLP